MQNGFRELKIVAWTITTLIAGCRKNEKMSFGNQSSGSAEVSTVVPTKEHVGLLRQDSYVAQSWYNLMLKLIKETPGHTPPVAARSFGYVGVTLYEALVGAIPHHHSLLGQLEGLSSIPQRKYGDAYAPPILANAALGRIIKYLFENASVENLERIDSLESANNTTYSKGVSDIIFDRSQNYGRAIAEAIYDWSRSDGGHKAYLNNFPADFAPPIGTDKWVPTPPLNQSALLPYWGYNRPMIAANKAGLIDPPMPPTFSTIEGSQFYDATFEVYYTRSHLNSDQRTVALYWADGGGSFTPPGHNIAIALQMIRNRNLNLSEAAVLLAKLGISENDAGIVCWRAKYNVNLLRPVTYIQSYIDPAWMPLINTPPFPSYTSGHSTFSGAAAAILTSEIGDNISFTDSSKMSDGFLPRSFSNFYAAAKEAAMSRLYAGIHYSFDNENGFRCGQLIAMNIERLNW
jgi:membrane-associated phospholipid phosphatase